MTDGQERSKEFWFEFDNVFNPTFGHVPGEVMAAYTSLAAHDDGIDYPYQRWREHRKRGTYPDGFRAEMTSIQDPVLFLCAKQAEVLDRHFAGDPDAQRTASEQFGEGVLFDQRRPVHQKVHQMDAALSPDSPPKGYYTWHGIIRAAVMVGADAGRWLAIDRSVGLAWGIHGEARPVQDAPDNPGLPPTRLEQLRSTWLAFSFDELDTAFDSEPWPPGIDRNVASQRAPSDFDQLRAPRHPGNDEHQPG